MNKGFMTFTLAMVAYVFFIMGRSYEVQLDIDRMEKENRDFKINELFNEMMQVKND